jgi:hypothetical protein
MAGTQNKNASKMLAPPVSSNNFSYFALYVNSNPLSSKNAVSLNCQFGAYACPGNVMLVTPVRIRAH